MRVLRSNIIIAILIIMTFMLIDNGDCAPWRRSKPKARVVKKKVVEKKAVKEKTLTKKRQHYRTHDVNNDGEVDLKDRLIWLRRNKGSYGTVLISTENKDLYEVMDANSDGNVGAAEMNLFYKKYDLDNNNLLEDEEIEAATK